MLSSYFSNIRNLVFDQSSPVQSVSESRGGTLSITEKFGRRTEILVSNIGYNLVSTIGNIVRRLKERSGTRRRFVDMRRIP